MNAETQRLKEARDGKAEWKKWGPYLAERQWGTVREDYSEGGRAWDYFTHDQARSRAYRWGEDGLAGISDSKQRLCFALALWNSRDPILKERLFGLTNSEGNHGEDVKEYYFYLDSTPTHSYMKYLYKYPQAAYPYDDLPTLWFRNRWSWGEERRKPILERVERKDASSVIAAKVEPRQVEGEAVGVRPPEGDATRYLYCDGSPALLFTENETNKERLFGVPSATPFVKDGIDSFVVHGRTDAVNPQQIGTKAGAHYVVTVDAGQSQTLRLRLSDVPPPARSKNVREMFGHSFDDAMQARRREADEFYAAITPPSMTKDAANVMRQALAGMMWGKQFYLYDVNRWLDEHGTDPFAPKRRTGQRNDGWHHMYNADIISMPDKWEYPWYAAWDLAFQVIALTMVDPDFGKDQIDLMLREAYMHPNGQIPAYEWNFGDVNPPVHAWATIFTYRLEEARSGKGDVAWLQRSFQKLLLNFTWWVNRKDRSGKNVFEGGFLGLDNIGVFDRSAPLPTGGYLEQADGTAWMALYCQNMMEIATELALKDAGGEEMVLKFTQHFLWIASAMIHAGDETGMWDEKDGFFYDVRFSGRGSGIPCVVSASRIRQRHVRRQLELAGADMDANERSAYPRPAAILQLLRQRVHHRMSHALRPSHEPLPGRRRTHAPLVGHLPAGTGQDKARVRRSCKVPGRPLLARLSAVLRILPRRQRRRAWRKPPDGLDRVHRSGDASVRLGFGRRVA
ncbi:hypothetical protein ACDY96_34390 [Rhizobium mongolense]|uniref:MGH1-like glycoside hydrolase domain-containing protein n=1 Tax=Rhizobium mongolense TaxID=57676 RepID=UPI0035573BE3